MWPLASLSLSCIGTWPTHYENQTCKSELETAVAAVKAQTHKFDFWAWELKLDSTVLNSNLQVATYFFMILCTLVNIIICD